MTGISDGMEAKKSSGLQTTPNNISLPLAMPPPPPPPPHTHTHIHTHTHKEKQTNRQTKKQKEKIPSLMKSHSHKKCLVKFPPPKNQGIRKHQTLRPQILLSPPSFGIRTSPGYREYPQMICFFHQHWRSFKATSVVTLF